MLTGTSLAFLTLESDARNCDRVGRSSQFFQEVYLSVIRLWKCEVMRKTTTLQGVMPDVVRYLLSIYLNSGVISEEDLLDTA